MAGAPTRAAWLPPLNALHTFEAAGRHLSFKRAAAELCVTPSAVSRQLKLLESHLGVLLFVRDANRLTLTTAGARYLMVVQGSFDTLAKGTDVARATRGARVVRVACVQALAANWLVPRLGHLMGQHPEIEIQLVTGVTLADVAGGEVDLAIRFGQGGWADVHSEPLLTLSSFPVCAPALAASLRAPHDLTAHPWLHLSTYPQAFRDWLATVRLPDANPARNLSFDSAELVFRAAECGLGVAMATNVLVAPYLESKRLTRPFAATAPIAGAYHLVCRADDLREPAVMAVRAFLVDAARDTNQVEGAAGQGPHGARSRLESPEAKARGRRSG